MITDDYNIVNVDFFVEYKISYPVQYLFASNNPQFILRNLIRNQIRNVVGSSSVDSVMENEYACVVRFSKIIETTDTAGLHFKVPFLDSVKSFSKAEYMRMLAEACDSEDKQKFCEFTIALDALKQSLSGKEKTIILSADSALAQLLIGNE